MKPTNAAGRRSFRGGGDGSIPATESGFVFAKLSPAAAFFLLVHGACCAASLAIGFRISRFLFLLLIASPNPSLRRESGGDFVLKSSNPAPIADSGHRGGEISSRSRVVVGRHGILIRPWPHPDPEQVLAAYRILARVQDEQRFRYGVRNPRRVIAVTPTHVRTFQALHLSGVMHSLMATPYEVTWIVVEAGGAATEETAALLRRSNLDVVHVPFPEAMPSEWPERHRAESRMRIHGLRIIRERKLDGIVVFMDESNVHGAEMFDEIQAVKWAGAMSMGILVHAGCTGPTCPTDAEIREGAPAMPIQGPLCDAAGNLDGLHGFDPRPYAAAAAVYVGEQGVVLPQAMEWAGFVLNSRLLWRDPGTPDWVKDFAKLTKNMVNPLDLFHRLSSLEPLGDCGSKVLLWWLRAEARPDSRFPPGWKIDAPLEVTVPAKPTPWLKPAHRRQEPGKGKPTRGE
ncbi:putative beta-1,4-xylosyltransferase IRX14 isoform X2 [Wolffia australiana]